MSSDSILREQAVQSPCPETSPQSRNLAGSGTFASDISIADAAKRARTESDANAAMLLLSCMRREDSLPALGEPIAA